MSKHCYPSEKEHHHSSDVVEAVGDYIYQQGKQGRVVPSLSLEHNLALNNLKQAWRYGRVTACPPLR